MCKYGVPTPPKFNWSTFIQTLHTSKLSIFHSGLFGIGLMQNVTSDEKPIRENGDSRCRLSPKDHGIWALQSCEAFTYMWFPQTSILKLPQQFPRKKYTFQNQRVGPISGWHSFTAKPMLPLTDRFSSNCHIICGVNRTVDWEKKNN